MAHPVARPPGGFPWRVVILAFIVYAYFMPRWADWNIDSRLDLSHALIDDHTVRIDRYHWNTWDKAVYQGHYYSDKAPGTALLGALVYGGFALARAAPILGAGVSAVERSSAWNVAIALGKTDTQAAPAARGRRLGGCQTSGPANVQIIPWGNRLYPPFSDWAFSKYVITVGVDGLLSALFAGFFFWFLGFFTRRMATRWILTLLCAFATVSLAYSTVFYSHQLVAGFLFTAFGLLYLRMRGLVGGWSAPTAGFLLGMSLLTEYTVALVVAVLGLYALWIFRRGLRPLSGFLLAGAVPVAVLMVYNYACFGSALDTGYSHDFCWSAAQAAGYAGFTTPKSGPLWDLTFGSFRGLFYMSPFLLLALPGAYVMLRRRLGLEALICLGTAAGFIIVISAYWGWNGGEVDGPRYLVPIVPFLAFPVLFFLDSRLRLRWTWIVTGVLAVWSCVVTWLLFLGGELFPTSWLRDPLREYSLPKLAGNHVAPNAGFFLGLRGWSSLIPLAVLVALVALWPLRPSFRTVPPRATSPVVANR